MRIRGQLNTTTYKITMQNVDGNLMTQQSHLGNKL